MASSGSGIKTQNLEKFGKLLTKNNETEEVEDLTKRERPERDTNIILHYSDFKTSWDWVVLTLTYYTAIVVPLVAAFHIKNRSKNWLIVDSLVDVFFILDVTVNFYTTRAGSEGEIVTDLKTIRIKYLKSWFLLDLMTCIPYDAITLLFGDIEANAQLLGAMKVFRLFRLFRIARDLDRYLAHAYASLIVLMSLILLLCHWMGCGWYNIALIDAANYIKSIDATQSTITATQPDLTTQRELVLLSTTPNPRLNHIENDQSRNLFNWNDIFKDRNDIFIETELAFEPPLRNQNRDIAGNLTTAWAEKQKTQAPVRPKVPKNWLVRLGEQMKNEYYWDSSQDVLAGGPPLQSIYSSCLYFTMTAVISQGFGNIYGETHNEQIFCIFILLVGCLLYATILGNVTTAMENISATEEQLKETMSSIVKFSELFQLPKHLQDSMHDYAYFTWKATHGISEKKVLDWLPEHMRLDASVYLHRHVMTTQPAFKVLSETSSRHIASRMERIHIAPGDLLIDKGEEIEYIYFVISGSLEIIQDDQIVSLVESCDSFGTTFWGPESKRRKGVNVSECAVHALTYVDLEIIRGEEVLDAMKLYTDIQRTLFRTFQLSFDLTKKLQFSTVKSVHWQKKVQEDEETAKKDRRYKTWLIKTRDRKKSTNKNQSPNEEDIIDLEVDDDTNTCTDEEESTIEVKGILKKSREKTKPLPKLFAKRENVVKLIPLSLPLEEHYKDQANFNAKCGKGPGIIISASVYDIWFNDDRTTEVRPLPDINFSLEEGYWMNMELPLEIKEILLVLLKFRSERISRLKDFNERLDKCEESISLISDMVQKMYG
uniref:potassium voltage-gated channel subfamily H member 5-like isoform X1 n=2 Tax=Styela clava TaxID=7725 RepID=UPI00193AC861|nr:potassium voltage-gated channel subfamily H member 5-like isoform X1 [Styela clava]